MIVVGGAGGGRVGGENLCRGCFSRSFCPSLGMNTQTCDIQDLYCSMNRKVYLGAEVTMGGGSGFGMEGAGRVIVTSDMMTCSSLHYIADHIHLQD